MFASAKSQAHTGGGGSKPAGGGGGGGRGGGRGGGGGGGGGGGANMATLAQKAEIIRAQLGMSPGAPFVEVINSAIGELGLQDETAPLKSLVEKADLCIAKLGASSNTGAAGIPMAVVVGEVVEQGMPVTQPIQPVQAAPPAVPTRPAAPHLHRDNVLHASSLAGCWGCACIPGGCAIEMKQNQGADTLVHKGIAFLFGALPITYEDKWHREGGTNTFKKAGGDDRLHYNCGSCFTCLGPGLVRLRSPIGAHMRAPGSILTASLCARPRLPTPLN